MSPSPTGATCTILWELTNYIHVVLEKMLTDNLRQQKANPKQ